MNKRIYRAFGVKRTSHLPYTHASQDNHGVVRFHQTYEAARRRSWNVQRVEVLT